MKNKHGFTLIELLIVVAIIAILAAIAVPNFLEAQVRAKVSRVKSDHRTLSTALESYHVDTNYFPPEGDPNTNPAIHIADSRTSLIRLTTPIAYITSLQSNMNDPFIDKRGGIVDVNTGILYRGYWSYNYADYRFWGPLRCEAGQIPATLNNVSKANYGFDAFGVASVGPDGVDEGILWGPFVGYVHNLGWREFCINAMYDPTNGTVSGGAIARVGGSMPGDVSSIIR